MPFGPDQSREDDDVPKLEPSFLALFLKGAPLTIFAAVVAAHAVPQPAWNPAPAMFGPVQRGDFFDLVQGLQMAKDPTVTENIQDLQGDVKNEIRVWQSQPASSPKGTQ